MKQFALLVFLTIVLAACKKDQTSSQSSEKSISVVELKKSDNPSLPDDISGVVSADSIKFRLLQNISLTQLIPSINFSGKSISPANHVAQNFSSPITYTITAEDGSTKNYTFRINGVDSTTMIAARWSILRDSLWDDDNYWNNGGGHPTPGVYTGTAIDYYDFGMNGTLSIHENGFSASTTYGVLSNNKLSVVAIDPYYGPANIEVLTSNKATISWTDITSYGARYFRRLYLKRL
jgi:hypothetical protein